jgi:hypothetical protein
MLVMNYYYATPQYCASKYMERAMAIDLVTEFYDWCIYPEDLQPSGMINISSTMHRGEQIRYPKMIHAGQIRASL